MTARPEAGGRARSWVGVTLAAAAVVALVLGVWAVVVRPGPDPVGGPTGGPAQSITIFPADELAVDTARTSAIDPVAPWPFDACARLDGEPDRVDFAYGREAGLEYARDLAVGWYVDPRAAELAYGAVVAAAEACAAEPTELQRADVEVGDTATVLVLTTPASGEAAEVSIIAIARAGSSVAVAVDRSTFLLGSVPAPDDAVTTTEQLERLVDQVCRAPAAVC